MSPPILMADGLGVLATYQSWLQGPRLDTHFTTPAEGQWRQDRAPAYQPAR